jgi:ammonia channel protein AmtB
VIWGGGVLAEWGVRDFAGGIVVHASAGWAALASVLYVGRRKFVDTPPTTSLSSHWLFVEWWHGRKPHFVAC